VRPQGLFGNAEIGFFKPPKYDDAEPGQAQKSGAVVGDLLTPGTQPAGEA